MKVFFFILQLNRVSVDALILSEVSMAGILNYWIDLCVTAKQLNDNDKTMNICLLSLIEVLIEWTPDTPCFH